MRIIRPYAKMIQPPSFDLIEQDDVFDGSNLLHDGIGLLQRVEWASRISHRSEDKVTDDSWKRIIQSVVIDHGDWSVTEHASVTADVYVDRGITHEWVRHRIGGYTQESTRFVNYEKKMPPSFIYPQVDVECGFCLSGHAHEIIGDEWRHDGDERDCAYDTDWLEAIAMAESKYIRLLGKGWRPQEARSVFPNALASRLIVTYNLRSWRHFFIMRTCAEAHPQMRQVTIPLLKEFQEKIPLLYDDITPNQKQAEAMKKAR